MAEVRPGGPVESMNAGGGGGGQEGGKRER